MEFYFVNRKAQLTGEHEVHKDGCEHMPRDVNQQFLGEFTNCHEAVKEAEIFYTNVKGCVFCCPECHKELKAE